MHIGHRDRLKGSSLSFRQSISHAFKYCMTAEYSLNPSFPEMEAKRHEGLFSPLPERSSEQES